MLHPVELLKKIILCPSLCTAVCGEITVSFSRDYHPSLKLEPRFSQHAKEMTVCHGILKLLCASLGLLRIQASCTEQELGSQPLQCEDSLCCTTKTILGPNNLISPLLTYVQAVHPEDLDTQTNMNIKNTEVYKWMKHKTSSRGRKTLLVKNRQVCL